MVPDKNATHSHSIVIISADEMALAQEREYKLLEGGHDHMFFVSASNFTRLEFGQTVRLTSVAGDHVHEVDLRC